MAARALVAAMCGSTVWSCTAHPYPQVIRYLITQQYGWLLALTIPILVNILVKKVVSMYIGPKQVCAPGPHLCVHSLSFNDWAKQGVRQKLI